MVAFSSFLFFNLIYTFFLFFLWNFIRTSPLSLPQTTLFSIYSLSALHFLFFLSLLSLPLTLSYHFLLPSGSLSPLLPFSLPSPPLIKGDVKQYKTPSTASINTDAKMPLMRLKIHKGQEFLVIWTRSNKHSFPFTFPRSGRFPRALSPSSFLRLPFKGGFSFGRLWWRHTMLAARAAVRAACYSARNVFASLINLENIKI